MLARRLLERIERDIVGLRREAEVLSVALEAGRHVVLEGPPGTGKSTLLRTVAEAVGIGLVFVEGNAELTPARLLGLAKGTLSVGADADLTVIDPDREWEFAPGAGASKSSNSPFTGWRLKGKAVATIARGQEIWAEAAGQVREPVAP